MYSVNYSFLTQGFALTRVLCALHVLKPKNMSSSAQATQIYPYASFVCTLQVRFLLSPFPIVLVAVSITVFARFDRNS